MSLETSPQFQLTGRELGNGEAMTGDGVGCCESSSLNGMTQQQGRLGRGHDPRVTRELETRGERREGRWDNQRTEQ